MLGLRDSFTTFNRQERARFHLYDEEGEERGSREGEDNRKIGRKRKAISPGKEKRKVVLYVHARVGETGSLRPSRRDLTQREKKSRTVGEKILTTTT